MTEQQILVAEEKLEKINEGIKNAKENNDVDRYWYLCEERGRYTAMILKAELENRNA